MYWSNYHSHCLFCDGRSTMEEFVKFAIAKGVKKYGFSSHAPLPFHTKWTMVEDNFVEYQAEFIRLKIKYENQIELFFGLEVDFIENLTNVNTYSLKDKSFDYIIGSIHYLDKLPYGGYWAIDGDFSEFDKGLYALYNGDINQAVRRYFEISDKMIENGGFDIVGHLDKIALNSYNYKEFNPKIGWYKNLVGELLMKVKEKGLILEINTKSVIEKGFTYPDQQFFPLIKELDIPIIVNSDCHYPTNVIDGFKLTYHELKKAGIKTSLQLINGNWEDVEFNENGSMEGFVKKKPLFNGE